MKVFTIGHGTKQISTFIKLLKLHKIQHVVDVRSFPSSKKNPQYNQRELRKSLQDVHIQYSHEPLLGGRRRDACGYNTFLTHPAFSSYAQYMTTEDFRAGLARLKAVARKHRVAFMCAETLWWRCHRRMISDALTYHGWKVYHILSDAAPARHMAWDGSRMNRRKQVIYDNKFHV